MNIPFLPPDPDVNDSFSKEGEIALTVNCRFDSGEIISTQSSSIISDPINPLSLLATHHTATSTNRIYIIEDDNTDNTCSGDLSHRINDSVISGQIVFISDNNPDEVTDITYIQRFRDISILGNFIIILSSEGIIYGSWNGTGYSVIPSHLPLPSIIMGARYAGILTDCETFEVDKRCLPEIDNDGGWSSNTLRSDSSKETLERLTQLISSQLNESIAEKVTPYGHQWQPVMVRYAFRMFDGNHIYHSPPCLIDPVVSPPVIKISNIAEGENETASKVDSTLEIPYFRLVCRIGYTAAIESLRSLENVICGIDIFVSRNISTYHLGAILPRIPYISRKQFFKNLIENAGKRPGVGESEANEPATGIYVGHYADNETSPFVDHELSPEDMANDNTILWRIPGNPHFRKDVEECSEFFYATTISFNDLVENLTPDNRYMEVDIPVSSFCNIHDKERTILCDDTISHRGIIPSAIRTINGRLLLGGIEFSMPDPQIPWNKNESVGNEEEEIAEECYGEITVWSKAEGTPLSKTVSYPIDYHSGDSIFDLLPRYLYYPDPSAYKIRIQLRENEVYEFPLMPHPVLYGSFFYAGCMLSSHITSRYRVTEEIGNSCSGRFSCNSMVMASCENNPFLFSGNNCASIGNGKISLLAPLCGINMSGNSGRYTLSAFSTDGIWAIEASKEGKIGLIQRIGGDFSFVNTAADTPDGVAYISGKRIKVVSNRLIDSLPSLPGYQAEISDYLSDARLYYDDSNRYLNVVNRKYQYCYSYSPDSKSWCVIDNSREDALIVTRPLKIATLDKLKRLTDIRIEGKIAIAGKVRINIFGSSDLYSWYPVAAGERRITGISGEPYRFFRLEILLPDHNFSIHGLTILTPRV